MKSKVKIGKRRILGEFARTPNGFDLSYNFEGDNCKLLYDGKVLTHKKSGEIPVEIDFCEGEKSECKIGDNSLFGSVEVTTRSLTVKESDGEIKVAVDYLLGEDETKIDISVYPEEKN